MRVAKRPCLRVVRYPLPTFCQVIAGWKPTPAQGSEITERIRSRNLGAGVDIWNSATASGAKTP